MAETSAAPERTLRQRMDALTRANNIRSLRARFKRQLAGHPTERSREQTARMLLRPAPGFESMHVSSLLLACRGVGDRKLNAWLKRGAISPSKTLGGLTLRQRKYLVLALDAAHVLSEGGEG